MLTRQDAKNAKIFPCNSSLFLGDLGGWRYIFQSFLGFFSAPSAVKFQISSPTDARYPTPSVYISRTPVPTCPSSSCAGNIFQTRPWQGAPTFLFSSSLRCQGQIGR